MLWSEIYYCTTNTIVENKKFYWKIPLNCILSGVLRFLEIVIRAQPYLFKCLFGEVAHWGTDDCKWFQLFFVFDVKRFLLKSFLELSHHSHIYCILVFDTIKVSSKYWIDSLEKFTIFFLQVSKQENLIKTFFIE